MLLLLVSFNIIVHEHGSNPNVGLYNNVNFTVGSTTASLDIITSHVNILEGDQKFRISIDSITNGHIVGTPSVAMVTVIDTTGECF